jgi:hypothetical protein
VLTKKGENQGIAFVYGPLRSINKAGTSKMIKAIMIAIVGQVQASRDCSILRVVADIT